MGTKVSKCIVCDNASFKDYYGVLIQCTNCNLVVASEIPNKKEISDLYQKEYFFGMEYFDYEADRPALERNFKLRIRSMKDMIGTEKEIIEIGCAYGYFMNLIKNDVNSSIGFDVTEEGVSYAKNQLGLNVTTADFMTYPFKKESIDSVFMWDVAEHIADPDKYIEKIAKLLKPGGKVAITTGDIDALVPRIRKSKWRMIHPPTHVYYFSTETLSRLLNKYNLDVVRVRHSSVSRNLGSVCNQLISNRKAKNLNSKLFQGVYEVIKIVRADRLNLPLNTFDIMEVIAQKR